MKFKYTGFSCPKNASLDSPIRISNTEPKGNIASRAALRCSGDVEIRNTSHSNSRIGVPGTQLSTSFLVKTSGGSRSGQTPRPTSGSHALRWSEKRCRQSRPFICSNSRKVSEDNLHCDAADAEILPMSCDK